MFQITDHPIIFDTPIRNLSESSWITHTPFAFFLISVLKPRVYVELGVFSGQSYCAVCQAVKTLKTGTECRGIDTWQGDQHASFYDDEVYDELSAHHEKEYGAFSRLLKMTFHEGAAKFKDKSIDLLHIDGLHTYEAVKNDFETWLPKMTDRGVVMFHDTFIKDLDFGVWKFWEEISAKYPSFEFYHGCGLGVAAVGKKVPKQFLEFIKDANRSGYYRRLFSTLGQLCALPPQALTINNIINSPEWKLSKKITSLLPQGSLRRKAADFAGRLAAGAVAPLKKISGFCRADRKGDADFYQQYYDATLKEIELMPLPLKKSKKKKCAIFVMVKDENVFLPIWLDYYSRYINGEDIYVFDHRTTDGSVEDCRRKYQFNVVRLEYPFSFDHVWFKFVADRVQRKLLKHYEYVIFTDVDEIILPDPEKFKGLDDYINKLDRVSVKCHGFELIHLKGKERPYDASRPVLSQRRFWYNSVWYDKTLISKIPLDWDIGFHVIRGGNVDIDNDLMLVHLHKLDFDVCWKKSFDRARLKWQQDDIVGNRGWQNRMTDIEEFTRYFYGWPDEMKIEEIPAKLRKTEIF